MNIKSYTEFELGILYISIEEMLSKIECEDDCKKCPHKTFCFDLNEMLDNILENITNRNILEEIKNI